MKRTTLFLISFLISLPFWWSVNYLQANLEEQFLVESLEKEPPAFFLAGIQQQYSLQQERLKEAQCSHILAGNAIAALVDRDGKPEIIFQKNIDTIKPIASITKLMTALIARDFLKPDQEVTISEKAVRQADETGLLKAGDKILVADLMRMALIESSNDAGFALAEAVEEQNFVLAMNIKAQMLGMVNSYFFNPTGLDDTDKGLSGTNYSTARDLVVLAQSILSEPEILEILRQKQYSFYLNDVFHHELITTNELLGEIPEIIGGKTGTTDLAGSCLLEILKTKNPEKYLVAVVLNSPDRFSDMRALINCAR
ncbi:MAG: serine hydrolase [Candidatus Pacebacteria bacterium]|nr:serine hydrolase [Candidatus Paceibacterota bacterium]